MNVYRDGGAHMNVTTLQRHSYVFERMMMSLVFSTGLRHLKAMKKVCQIADIRKPIQKMLQFRVGGVNIDVTTLQRETYFLNQLSDVCCGLQVCLLFRDRVIFGVHEDAEKLDLPFWSLFGSKMDPQKDPFWEHFREPFFNFYF